MSLHVEKVSKRYSNKWILRDLTFQVQRGEIFGLIGAASSGKSTILRLISGLEKDFTGNILFENSPIAKANIFPSPSKSFFSFFSKKSTLFSDSERTKAEFEKALNNAENLLLLDNPFTYFDNEMRQEAIEKLRQKTKEKKLAVVFVTNNYEEIFRACDRIGILHKGEIIQEGSPKHIYEEPNSSASASLLGRCNFITARRISFSKDEIPEFQTLQGNHRLRTDKVERKNLGSIVQDIILAIRPENICIYSGASFPEDNLVRAKVTNIEFHGSTTRVELDADGLLLEAIVLRLVGLKIGDECVVGLPPKRIKILRY
jgi:ABC-type Fe3+/spermidine/putrescine transport system ATPase subunit